MDNGAVRSRERFRSRDAKAGRRADRALLATYHEAKLADLVEHVRAGFASYDAGQIDAFQLEHEVLIVHPLHAIGAPERVTIRTAHHL